MIARDGTERMSPNEIERLLSTPAQRKLPDLKPRRSDKAVLSLAMLKAKQIRRLDDVQVESSIYNVCASF